MNIAKIIKASNIPSGYTVRKNGKRKRKIVRLSPSDVLLRACKARNRKSKIKVLRRLVNAYDRGSQGISKRYTKGIINKFTYEQTNYNTHGHSLEINYGKSYQHSWRV